MSSIASRPTATRSRPSPMPAALRVLIDRRFAHGPPGSRFFLGEEGASVNIRPIMRTPRTLSHLLPARGLGETK